MAYVVPQEGFRTPDPIITNDVLYRLSYCGLVPAASRELGSRCFRAPRPQATRSGGEPGIEPPAAAGCTRKRHFEQGNAQGCLAGRGGGTDLPCSPSLLAFPAHLPCSPSLLTFPAHLPGSTFPAHLPCSPSLLTFPAHLPCSPSLLTFPAHLPCSPSLLTFPARLPCSPSLLTFPAHLPCSPSLLAFPARLPCSPSLLAFPARLPCSPSLLAFPARLPCSPSLHRSGEPAFPGPVFIHLLFTISKICHRQAGAMAAKWPMRCMGGAGGAGHRVAG